METITESGLILSEAHARTSVMYPQNDPPMDVQRWDGWPLEWATPDWNTGAPNWWRSRVSTVMTCVDLNTRTWSTMPLIVAQGAAPIAKQPAWATNPAPTLYSNMADWIKVTGNSLYLRGEAIIIATARDASGYPAQWVTVNPDLINIEFKNGTIVYELGQQQLDPADILHVKYQVLPGSLRGCGPLEWIARNLISAEALEAYGSDLAARGGVPWGIIKHPGNLQKGQAEALSSQWVKSTANRGGAPVVLSGGMDLVPFSINPADMALLSLREFDEQRIAAALGCPPFLVGLPQPSGLTYNTAEGLFDFHWRATLRPIAMNLAGALSQWALPVGTRSFFDSDDYVRLPLAQRAAAYAALYAIYDPETGQRAMTIDEIRAEENRVPMPKQTPKAAPAPVVVAPAAPVSEVGE